MSEPVLYCYGLNCIDKYNCTKYLYGYGKTNADNFAIKHGTNRNNCQYFTDVVSKNNN